MADDIQFTDRLTAVSSAAHLVLIWRVVGLFEHPVRVFWSLVGFAAADLGAQLAVDGLVQREIPSPALSQTDSY